MRSPHVPATAPVPPPVTGAPASPDSQGAAHVEGHGETGALSGIRTKNQHQRRKRIIQAAAALASRGGVEAMQMRTVAERAGVALGTLYRYFPSKMDLVVAVVAEEIDLLESSIQRRPPNAPTAAGRSVDVLMRATRGLMREPELADALIRSLIITEAKTPFEDRMAGLLLRVSTDAAAEPTEEQLVLTGSLASVWVHELLEMLRGRRTYEQIQRRVEIAAARLLAGF